MAATKSRWTGWWVPIIALVAVLGSGAWLGTQEVGGGWFGWDNGSSVTWQGGGDGRMMGGSGYGWLPGDGDPVDNLEEASDRAAKYAVTLESDLTVGEVMKFSNQYYAELQEPDGTKATEVLIDPGSGAVALEFGPARMWNTRLGMMSGGDGNTTEVTASRAEQLANQWLADRNDGLTADTAEAFPGYYTLHTLKDGKIEGMLSVNSTTSDVWDHSWHGDFEGMSEGS